MSQKSPKRIGPISVSVCNYNGAEHLRPCLDALLAQERAPDEIVVVDNDSTDDSLSILKAEYPSVRVIATGVNGGPCPARNRGLREAQHEWVVLVDNDAVLAPDCLGKLEAALLEEAERSSEPLTNFLVQPRSVFDDDRELVHYDGGELHYAGLFSLRNFYTPLAQARAQANGQGIQRVPGMVSVAFLVHAPTLLEMGAFDETYFILFEDLDLSFRWCSQGRAILSMEDALCYHRGGTAGMSFRSGDYPGNRALMHSRNRFHYLFKNYRWRTLLLISPGLVLYELVWALFTIRSGTFFDYLRGKLRFLSGLAATLKARSQNAVRSVPDRQLLVGGPLTISPNLRGSGLARMALGGLNLGLRAWWGLVRVFCG